MPATRTSRSDVQAMAAVYPFNIYATVHRIVQVCKQTNSFVIRCVRSVPI